ncbi:ribokinase [Cellulophaga baltica]|uniref:ribokinase n=1 Tax=Cellulophaga TaxID=104264 RepID=UPI001C0767A2|nr:MULTISPECIES: ribokinase [Cellulophaga]MBU2996666.1 ribokinase [Cellulophaga baltica]MDO6768060.1 ribokinase [Cellulophaga sp. 1_MG-2023]
MNKKIIVIGSTNLDLVFQTENFPKPGETIKSKDFSMLSGGKGSNQAIAASRLGGNVSFISKIGNDDFGQRSIKELNLSKVNCDYVFTDHEAVSGVAVILINEKGENSIVMAPGANNLLSVSDIDNASPIIKNAAIILIQLEISIDTVKYLLKTVASSESKIIFNPAPMHLLDDWMYAKIYLITPNESESESLTGIKITDIETASQAADYFLNKGVKNVVITLGAKGAFFKNKDEEFHIPAKKVKVVDTTGAGDVFNGALAVALGESKNWREIIKFAIAASTISVGKLGAQTASPYRSEIISNN